MSSRRGGTTIRLTTLERAQELARQANALEDTTTPGSLQLACELWSDVILTHPTYAYSIQATRNLWNLFYPRIQQWRQSRRRREKNPTVKDAIALYAHLVEKLRSYLATDSASSVSTSETAPIPDPNSHTEVPAVLASLYTNWGDLYRYDKQDSQQDDSYKTVIRLAPGNGHGFNQMSVTAYSKREYFSSLYWYIRAMRTQPSPYQGGERNLNLILRGAESRSDDTPIGAALTQLTQTCGQGLLHEKVTIDLTELSHVLSQKAMGDALLMRLVCVLVVTTTPQVVLEWAKIVVRQRIQWNNNRRLLGPIAILAEHLWQEEVADDEFWSLYQQVVSTLGGDQQQHTTPPPLPTEYQSFRGFAPFRFIPPLMQAYVTMDEVTRVLKNESLKNPQLLIQRMRYIQRQHQQQQEQEQQANDAMDDDDANLLDEAVATATMMSEETNENQAIPLLTPAEILRTAPAIAVQQPVHYPYPIQSVQPIVQPAIAPPPGFVNPFVDRGLMEALWQNTPAPNTAATTTSLDTKNPFYQE